MYSNGTTKWSTTGVPRSNLVEEDDYHWTYVKQYFYVVLGGFAAVTNFLLTIVISRHAALRRRKEYIIIGGLSFADFVEGFATSLAGAYRLAALNHGWSSVMVSPLTCMALASHILWRWSDIATSLMLLAVSCDRLFAVSKPLMYYQRGQSYAVKTVLTVYCIAIGAWFFVWPHPIAIRNSKVPAMCISTKIISPIFYQFSKYTTSLSSALSVIVYILVVLILQRRTRALRRCTDSTTLRRQTKVQRKLTVTLGISRFLTLLLDAVPRAVGMHLYLDEDLRRSPDLPEVFSPAPYFFLMTKLNAMANVFIFSLRQPEIRHGMRHLLSWSQLPVDLNLWDVTSRMGSDPRINPRGTYRKRTYGMGPTMREVCELEQVHSRQISTEKDRKNESRSMKIENTPSLMTRFRPRAARTLSDISIQLIDDYLFSLVSICTR